MNDALIPPTPSDDDYRRDPRADLPPLDADDPLTLFADWLTEAAESEPNDPNALCLATVDGDGLPDARMVLLKEADAAGFVFYSHLDSAKGRQLAAQPKAAMLFHWKTLRRQVRVRGPVESAPEGADAYFASRARLSRLGAWASEQSRPLDSRATLLRRLEEADARFAGGEPPRPEGWSGFRLKPLQIEFWRDGAFRLHERLLFQREVAGAAWRKGLLHP